MAFSLQSHARSIAGDYLASIEDNGRSYFTNYINDEEPVIFMSKSGETWSDQTKRLQQIINHASLKAKGGVIKLIGDEFRLGQIELKNNIRLEIDANATIFMMEKVLFDMGRGASNTYFPERQHNIEITSLQPNQKFTIDVNKKDKKRNAIPFRVGYVYNFSLSNFHIDDYYTIFPSVFIVADSDNRKEWNNQTYARTAFKGALINASANNVHTGYALVQPFSGKRLYFKDLDAEGGLTVRLEPGSGKSNDYLNRAGQLVGTIADVRLINIHNSNGMAALFLKSHQKIISQIHATNITATDSAFSIMSNSSDSKEFERGYFQDIKVDGIVRLDRTTNDILSDIGPSSQYYVPDSHLAELQALALADYEAGNRSNSNPIYSDLPLSPTEDYARRETRSIAPILMASSDSKDSVGSRFLGRWQYDLSNAQIEPSNTIALEHANLDLYRDSAKLLNGRDATDWALEKAWDIDNDGIKNRFDEDFDGDGVNNKLDQFPYDATNTLDSDFDGFGDNEDAFPLDSNEHLDSDQDGIGNNADTDDDNDRYPDSQDQFPLDPTEWLDTDDDSIGNNKDIDDDHDGIVDSEDAFPLDYFEQLDTDRDGIGNNTDTDDDNDSVPDNQDALPLDPTVGILADLNFDHFVDAKDLVIFNQAINQGNTLHPIYDLNGDSVINNHDRKAFISLCSNQNCGIKH